MKERVIKLLKNNYFIIVIISLMLSAPLIIKGLIVAHDSVYHISKAIGTVNALKEGQFFPYIVSNFANGFGYSWNLFYPPISTYGVIFFRIFSNSYINGVKLLLVATLILSGTFMYNFMHDVTKNKMIALLSAIIYITAPYRLTVIYIRMAIGEIISFVFVPLVFHGLYNIFNQDCKKHWYLVIGACGLALTHNISTLLTIIPAIIYVLFNIKKVFTKKVFLSFLIDALFMIGIVAFFYGPMMEAKFSCDYSVFDDGKMGTLEDMHQHSVYISQLIFGKMQRGISGYLSDPENISKDMCFAIGLQILIPLLFTPFAYKKIDVKKRKIYLTTLITGLLLLFATTNLFPWTSMPSVFAFIQFPYRFLFISTFLLSIISAINIVKVFKEIKFSQVVILCCLILVYIFPLVRLASMDKNHDETVHSEIDVVNKDTDRTDNCAYFEYLPSKTTIPYLANRSQDAIVLSGNTTITEQEKEKSSMKLKVENTVENTDIELPYVYYPGYKVTLNGNNLSIKESANGFVSITLEQGSEGEINVNYASTLVQKISFIISSLTALIFIIYIIFFEKKHIQNYRD